MGCVESYYPYHIIIVLRIILSRTAMHAEADFYKTVNMSIQSSPFNTDTDRAIENGCSYKGRLMWKETLYIFSIRTK